MNSSDEAMLSRYLDHDLTTSEAIDFDSKLSSDQALRLRLKEYRQVRHAIGSLPEPTLAEDMVERLAPLLLKESTGVSLWARLAAGAGARWVAASAAFVLLSSGITLIIVNNKSSRAPVSGTLGIASSAAISQSSDTRKSGNSAEIIQPDLKVAAEVAVAPALKDQTGIDQQNQALITASKPKIEPDLAELVKMLEKVDRRHFLQVQVDTANERVVNRIIRILEKYRIKPAKLAIVNDGEDSEEPKSIDIVAVVPTGLVNELNRELKESFDGKLELHKPYDDFDRAGIENRLATIPPEMLTKAMEEPNNAQAQLRESQSENRGSSGLRTEAQSQTQAPARANDRATGIPPVELKESGQGSSFDEVVLRIRSDAGEQRESQSENKLNTRKVKRKNR
jgi:hypothetical protein